MSRNLLAVAVTAALSSGIAFPLDSAFAQPRSVTAAGDILVRQASAVQAKPLDRTAPEYGNLDGTLRLFGARTDDSPF